MDLDGIAVAGYAGWVGVGHDSWGVRSTGCIFFLGFLSLVYSCHTFDHDNISCPRELLLISIHWFKGEGGQVRGELHIDNLETLEKVEVDDEYKERRESRKQFHSALCLRRKRRGFCELVLVTLSREAVQGKQRCHEASHGACHALRYSTYHSRGRRLGQRASVR